MSTPYSHRARPLWAPPDDGTAYVSPATRALLRRQGEHAPGIPSPSGLCDEDLSRVEEPRGLPESVLQRWRMLRAREER